MASSRQLTTRQQMGGISPYPHAVVRAAATVVDVQQLTGVLPQQNFLGGCTVGNTPSPILVHLQGTIHVLGKNCVFIAGSFFKKSVLKAGTTECKYSRPRFK